VTIFNRLATALIVVDAQVAFEEWESEGQRRNNPQAVANMTRLLNVFRGTGAAIFHIRHAGTRVESRFRPDRPGFQVMKPLQEVAGEPVIVKNVNSAFIGTDLEPRLRNGGISCLVIVGITTNHCVETTARMAGNLGFDTKLVADATYTFDRVGPDGIRHTAQQIQQMTLSNLSGEFAEIVHTAEVVANLKALGPARR
jgi:nicotinamidase-related amidase